MKFQTVAWFGCNIKEIRDFIKNDALIVKEDEDESLEIEILAAGKRITLKIGDYVVRKSEGGRSKIVFCSQNAVPKVLSSF
jgi:hypothetical protein